MAGIVHSIRAWLKDRKQRKAQGAAVSQRAAAVRQAPVAAPKTREWKQENVGATRGQPPRRVGVSRAAVAHGTLIAARDKRDRDKAKAARSSNKAPIAFRALEERAAALKARAAFVAKLRAERLVKRQANIEARAARRAAITARVEAVARAKAAAKAAEKAKKPPLKILHAKQVAHLKKLAKTPSDVLQKKRAAFHKSVAAAAASGAKAPPPKTGGVSGHAAKAAHSLLPGKRGGLYYLSKLGSKEYIGHRGYEE